MRILFLSYTNIGDVVMSTALLNRVLVENPDAIVDVVVGGRAAELFEGLPQLGRLITLKKEKNHRHYLTLMKKLKHELYDLLIDLRTPFFKWGVQCKRALVYKNRGEGQKVASLGELWPSSKPLVQKVWIKPRVAEVVATWAKEIRRPMVVVGPTANWAGKQWPQKRFVEWVEAMLATKEYRNATFVLLGAPNERGAVLDLLTAIPEGNKLDLVGKTTIAESYAWISEADLFVGHDSGLSHLAAAAGTPSVTLFGPMNDKIYAPWSDVNKTVLPPMRKWRMVNLPKGKYLPRIITDITVEHVLGAVQAVGKTTKKRGKRHA